MSEFRVYSRPGCHLCEVLVDELLPMIRGRATVEIVDIDTRDDWARDFAVRIPVLEFGGKFVCQHHLDAAALRPILDSLPDRDDLD